MEISPKQKSPKKYSYSLTLRQKPLKLIYMFTILAEVAIGQRFKFGNEGVDKVFPDIATLVNVLLKNAYILAGIILLLLLIFGGFTIIVNAGKNPQEMAKGNQAITAALIGFVIIFASYWVINIINYIVPIAGGIFK